LYASFAATQIAILLGVAMASLGLTQLQHEKQRRADLAERQDAIAQWSALVQGNLDRALLATRLEAAAGEDDAVVSAVAPIKNQLVQKMSDSAGESDQRQRALLADESLDERTRTLVDTVLERRTAFVQLRTAIQSDLLLGEGATRIEAELAPAAQAMMQALTDLAQAGREEATLADATGIAKAKQALWWLAAGSLLGLLAAIVLARAATRAITQPLEALVSAAQHVAAGNLTRPAAVNRHDELGALQRALADMQQSLAVLVERVRRTTDDLGRDSDEVSQGHQDLSLRTEQAATSLQHTRATLQALAQHVTDSADHAQEAAQLTRQARDGAIQGGQVVARVVDNMAGIQSASRRIADITAMIDGIAFQTNILALNAAVEAARAGEQGRGFAVVASEVRSLAQKSAQAAREIKTLIGQSVQRVEEGHALVQDAGSTMEDVVASIRRVSQQMEGLEAAAQHQRSGMGEVGAAVQQLDQSTQQNAAMVQQGNQAAQSLRDKTSQLRQAVAAFHL
jgi:methyl-accepting chemotaxis protein